MEAIQLPSMSEFTKLAGGFAFTECPRWHNGHLYFSDQHGYRVYQASVDGLTDDIAVIPNRPSGLGFLPDGRLLIASMCDRKILRLEDDGALSLHAKLSALAAGDINDMLVDSNGRAWVGITPFSVTRTGSSASGTTTWTSASPPVTMSGRPDRISSLTSRDATAGTTGTTSAAAISAAMTRTGRFTGSSKVQWATTTS